MWVRTLRNVDITRISHGHISVLLEDTVTRLGMLVVLQVLRMLKLRWPIQGQGQGAKNCTFLGLSPQPFQHVAQNWWLIMTAWRSPIFEFPFKKAIMWVHTSQNVDITRLSNGHISVLLEATVTWSGTVVPVVLYVLRMLIWPWPDPRSRSRSLTLSISANCTFLRLSPPPFWRGAQKWWLITTVWDLVYSYSEQDFWISSPVGGHVTS